MGGDGTKTLTASADEATATVRGQATLLHREVTEFLERDPDLADLAAAYAALSQLIDDARTLRDRVEARGVDEQRRLDEKVVALTGVGTFELKTKTETSGFQRDDCIAAVVRLLTDERPVDPETGEVIDADPRYGRWILRRFNEAFRAEPRATALRALGVDPEEFHAVWNRKGTVWRFDPADRFDKAGAKREGRDARDG